MSLDRKDLRIKLDADDHAALALCAECDDAELAEWAERLGLAGKALPADE